jgi:type IV pilus assembly protein PilN
MRITLNLASKPFIELRPLYARLRWWMAILLIVAIPLWLLLKTEQRKAAASNASLQSVEANIQRLRSQQQSYQAMMRQPNNAAVLTQSVFLNQLFARKAFSWTAIMMDLETVLPGGVQVMNIDPSTDKSGNVTIRLRINGQRDRAVELIRNLEHSRRFLQPRLASESAETNNNGGGQANFQPASGTSNVNFDVLADYNPLQAKETTKGAVKGSSKDAADSTSAKKAVKTGPKKGAVKHPAPPVSRPHPAARQPARVMQ